MSPLWILGPVWVSIAVLLYVRFRKWSALKRELSVPPPPYDLMRFTVIEPGHDIWPVSTEEPKVSFGTTPKSLYTFGKSKFHDSSRPTSFVCTRVSEGVVLTAAKEILVNGVGHRKRLLVTGDKIFFDEIRIVFDGVATVQPEPAPAPKPTFVALGAPLAALALFAVFVRDPIPIRRLRRSSQTPSLDDRARVDPEVAPPGTPPVRSSEPDVESARNLIVEDSVWPAGAIARQVEKGDESILDPGDSLIDSSTDSTIDDTESVSRVAGVAVRPIEAPKQRVSRSQILESLVEDEVWSAGTAESLSRLNEIPEQTSPPLAVVASNPTPAEPTVRGAAPIVSEPPAEEQTQEAPGLTLPPSVSNQVERRAAEAASARRRNSTGKFPIVAESAWPLGATSQPSAKPADVTKARIALVEGSAWPRGRAPEIAIVSVPDGNQATVSDAPDESLATPNEIVTADGANVADAADSSSVSSAQRVEIPGSGLSTLAETPAVEVAAVVEPFTPEVGAHEEQEATLPEASPLAAMEQNFEEPTIGADSLAASAAALRGQSVPAVDGLEKQIEEVSVAVAAVESSASRPASSEDATADAAESEAAQEVVVPTISEPTVDAVESAAAGSGLQVGDFATGLQIKPLASFGPSDEPEFFDADMMFIHAHPDDEAIDFGGLMARMSRLGRRIVTIIFTDGESGIDTYPDRLVNDVYPPHDLSGSELATVRRMELERSLLVLGSDHYLRLGLPNNPYDGIEDVIDPADVAERWGGDSLVDQIARLIEQYQPDVVVSPDGPTEDAIEHFEHEAVGLIVERALQRLDRVGESSFLEGHLTSIDPKFVHLFADAQGLDVTGTDSQSSLTFRGIQIEALKQHVTQADAAKIAVNVIEDLAFEHYLARQWSSAQSLYQFFEYPTLAFGEKR